jgi:hypothetical protein
MRVLCIFVLFYVLFVCDVPCTFILFTVVPCTVCVYMCTEQLPPGGYPIAVKYIICHIKRPLNTFPIRASS